MRELSAEELAQVSEMLRGGGRLPALKRLRELTGASLPDFKVCGLYVGKSSARAELPVVFAGEDGRQVSGTYVVFLDRVATRWTVKRYEFRPAG